ncbi:MAG: hypothetical protein U9R42_14565, partial [Bacteroidota bacterium]|nr:hypothetical protein [Bacteroidota bacterium]
EFIATTTTADLIFQRADATSTNLLFYLDNVKVEEIGESYRFGFNGQEKDDEITGITGSHYTATFWEYDARLGRRWNLDPKPNPPISQYNCFAGNPIWYSDVLGDSLGVPKNMFNSAMAGTEGYNEQGLNLKEWGTFSSGIKDVTGISLNTPSSSDNVLTVASIDKNIGSKTARSVFSRALGDKDIINTEIVNNDPNIDFATWCSAIPINTATGEKGEQIMELSSLKLDLSDISNISYRNVDKRAFGVGLIMGHELIHRYGGNEDKAVGYMNMARTEMGLSQRLSYSPNRNDWLPAPKLYILRFGDILENGQKISTGGVFLPANK